MRGEYSLADIKAVTDNGTGNGMFGGDWAWIIVLFLIFGWGRNGFGGSNGGAVDGYVLATDFANIERKLDSVNNGICDSTFALNNSINNGFFGVQNALTQGFSGLNTAVLQGNYALSSQLSNCCCGIERQIADCCCRVERGIDGINYNNAMQTNALQQSICNSTRDILESNNNNTRAILDFLTKDKIDTLQAENQALRFQASQTAQNAFFTANQDAQTAELIRRLGADCPVPAYVVQPSTPVSFPVNCCGQFTGFNSCNNY